MMLDLTALKELPARLTLDEDANKLEMLVDGMTVLEKVRAELEIMPGDNIYYCRGQVVCNVEMECSRCLEPYRDTLQGEIDFSMRELVDGREVSPDELPETELVVADNATEVDITGPIREALMLAVPLKPLCREDCRGLCPVCGANRNEHECQCKVEKTDSRWEGLRDLLK
jgi:uncharacterized protein